MPGPQDGQQLAGFAYRARFGQLARTADEQHRGTKADLDSKGLEHSEAKRGLRELSSLSRSGRVSEDLSSEFQQGVYVK
jgi:hypothetical protein